MTITLDSASSDSAVAVAGLNVAHTVGEGEGRILIVGVSTRNNAAVTTIQWNGNQNFTKIRNDNPASDVRSELWYLIEPAAASANVAVSIDTSESIVVGVTSWFKVNQVIPIADDTGATGTSQIASLSIDADSGQLVIDNVAGQDSTLPTVGSGQTQRYQANTANNSGSGSTEPGASTITMDWDFGSSKTWAQSAAVINPGPVDDDIRLVSLDETNSFGLQSTTATTSMDNVDSIMQSTRFKQNRVTRGGIEYFDSEFSSKNISLNGILKNTSKENLKQQIDDFKKIIIPRDSDGGIDDLFLDIKNTGDTQYRRYQGVVTNLDNVIERDHFNNTWVPFNLIFQSNEKGRDLENQLQQVATGPALTETYTIQNDGDDTTFPVFTVELDSVSSSADIELKNTSMSGRNTLTFTGTLTTSDIYIYNFNENTLTKNGTEVEALGNWFPLLPGSNTITLTTTGSGMIFTTTITHKNRYL